MSERITAALLQRHHACPEALVRFKSEWPHGAEVTVANVLRALELGLAVSNWGRKLLPAPAWEAYDEAIATAERAYAEAIAPAGAAYKEAMATEWAAYKEAMATAWVQAWGAQR